MSNRSIQPFFLALLVFYLCVPPLSAQGSDYETIRFYNKRSKPEKLVSHVISPNGRLLAMSFDRSLGGRKGITIVDLKKKEIVSQIANFSYFTLAFSSDSGELLGIGGYAGTKVFDLPGKRSAKVATPALKGKIGIDVEERNGKLLVTQVFEGYNPTIDDQVRVGDEVLAINEGQTPTRYNDQREWVSLLGKPLDKALEAMAGRPNTWVQLRLDRRGRSEPVVACVQRQWPSDHHRMMPPNGSALTIGLNKKIFQFRSADTGTLSACLNFRDIRKDGLKAISDDARFFASVAYLVDKSDFCVEVHSMADGVAVQSALLEKNNFRDIRFAPDGESVLVGTRDTVEILDIASGEWQEPVVLTAPEDVDQGRIVTRKIPLGLGLPGDLYTTSRDVVYAKPAALSMFDVSSTGTLAVASETGDIVLASLGTKERIALVGDNILGGRPTMIEFAPDGRSLVTYAQGVLHIFELGAQQADPAAEKKPAADGEPPI